MSNPRFNKQTAEPRGRVKAMGGGMMRRDMRSGYYPSDMGMEGGAIMIKKIIKKIKQLFCKHNRFISTHAKFCKDCGEHIIVNVK